MAVIAVRAAALAIFLSTPLLVTACGGSGKPTTTLGKTVVSVTNRPRLPRPGRFLTVDASAHRVTVKLIASYDDANNGFNFDGYSRELMWAVPRGWTVQVVCENRGSSRNSCAVVQGSGSLTPAFAGAATPTPAVGLAPGRTARFTFRATKPGSYRFVSLVPGHEAARMWDVLEVTRGGTPSVVNLEAR